MGEAGSGDVARRVPARMVAAVCLATLLNPLNSSMIAVALVRLRDDFGVRVADVSWLISAFYLTAAVCQPLAGRIADQFGARRVLCLGLVVVCLTGLLAPLSGTVGVLVGFRVVQAAGTSTAFPCGLILIRAATGRPDRPPTAALGVVAVAASLSAALGPVLGGALLAVADWQAIFLVNVPVTLAGLAAAFAWLPADHPAPKGTSRPPVRLDPVGVALFAVALTGLLGFLLSVPGGPIWALAPVGPVAAGLLVRWERRVDDPFLDVRMLAANRPLLAVYAQFAAINVAFYGAFYALPLWFEQERGMSPGSAGLLLLPIAGLGLLATPAAVRFISWRGPRSALLLGTGAMGVGALLALGFGATTPVWSLALVCALLGLPNAFTNLGLQAALFALAPAEVTGTAAGLYQTARYLGAILSSSLLGLVFATAVTTGGLHLVAVVMVVISAVLLVASVTGRHSPPALTRR